MANYNSGKFYNRKITNGGAIYNSSTNLNLIIVLDSGHGADDINNISISLNSADEAICSDAIALIASIELTDKSNFIADSIIITSTIDVSDNGACDDTIYPVQSAVSVSDSSTGTDNIGVAGSFFSIDKNSILQPLGVKVLRDSRCELMPATKDITEEIPGMHGEIDLGSEFKARNLELHVVTNNGYTPLEKAQLQRLFAKYLDPSKGTKTLIFSDDVDKTYTVKFSGKIDPIMYATWFEFTLPFKMSNPFIKGSFEKILTGSGTLVNGGTFETPMIIEITGPATNPSIAIGTKTLSYTGTIPSGQTLIIDTGLGTAILNGANALAGINGELPLYLQPGDTNLIASSNVKIKWRDCWL